MKLKNNRVVDDVYNSRNYPRLYRIWSHAKHRCNNPNAEGYKYYGGKGIRFCDEWDKFAPFCKWSLENGYEDTLTLDRIDSKLGYSPSNCRWVSICEQANNRRTNTFYTYNGETHTLAEWADIFGINYDTILSRFSKGKRGTELFKEVALQKGGKREVLSHTETSLMGWTKIALIKYVQKLENKIQTVEDANKESRKIAIEEFAERLRQECLNNVYHEVWLHTMLKISKELKGE